MALLDDLPVDWSVNADDEAFDVMYRQHKTALLAFCRSRLGDAGDAEDACQEAFLRAYRALPRFDRTQRMWPWLATIAANACTDMKRRRRAIPLSACDDRPREAAVDPNDEIDARDRRRLVGAALRELPESYRRPVYLADGEGWSYGEIALADRRSVASVRSSLMRGRAAFKARAQAIAEERGMWPLSAAVPFRWVRSRILAWRDARGTDLAAVAAPGASTAVQAAVAAISLLGALVPGAMAVAGAQTNTPAIPVQLARTFTAPAAPVATAPTGGSSTTRAAAPVVARIDLAGGQRSVDSGVTVTDDRTRAWLGVQFDCTSQIRQHVCDGVDVAANPLP